MTETQDVARVLVLVRNEIPDEDMHRKHLDPSLEAKRQKAIQYLRTKSRRGWVCDRKVHKMPEDYVNGSL